MKLEPNIDDSWAVRSPLSYKMMPTSTRGDVNYIWQHIPRNCVMNLQTSIRTYQKKKTNTISQKCCLPKKSRSVGKHHKFNIIGYSSNIPFPCQVSNHLQILLVIIKITPTLKIRGSTLLMPFQSTILHSSAFTDFSFPLLTQKKKFIFFKWIEWHCLWKVISIFKTQMEKHNFVEYHSRSI